VGPPQPRSATKGGGGVGGTKGGSEARAGGSSLGPLSDARPARAVDGQVRSGSHPTIAGVAGGGGVGEEESAEATEGGTDNWADEEAGKVGGESRLPRSPFARKVSLFCLLLIV